MAEDVPSGASAAGVSEPSHEPGTLPLRPVLIVAAILALAALAYAGYSCVHTSGGSGNFSAPVSQFPAGSVTYIALDRMYLARRDDGSFVTLSEIEAAQADRTTGCVIRYRPDLSAEGQAGVFRDDCHGTLFNRDGIAIQGSAPPMQQHPVRASKDTVVVETKVCLTGGGSAAPEPCRE